MSLSALIKVNFTGTTYGSGDTFTVQGASNAAVTGITFSQLDLTGTGYEYTYINPEVTFTVTSETGVCAGQVVGSDGIAPTATPGPTLTPTETPGPTITPGPTETPGPTFTPTPEPPQLQFFIQSQEYSSPEQACDGDLPGTSVFVTASVVSFENFVNNLGTFTTGEKTIYLDNGLTPGNEFGGTGLFHLADSDGVGAGTHALRVSSGVVDLSQPCVTPTPTPEQITVTEDVAGSSTFDVTGSLAGVTFNVSTVYNDTVWLATEENFPDDNNPLPQVDFTIITSTSGQGDGIVTITVPANNTGELKRSFLRVTQQGGAGIVGQIVITQNAT